MQSTLKILSLLFMVSVITISCQKKKSSATEEAEVQETSSILLSPVDDSPAFDDAMLTMNNPEEFGSMDAGMVNFSYDVKNYELAAQTSDAGIKQCANSKDGQHIHLILNNEPYTAHYDASFDKELEAGHYVSLSFLSRSYHESIKNPEAYVLRQFTVGDIEAEEADLSTPHMFYSRPKGSYKGDDTKKLLLDFYLVNTDLSKDGNKVRATINDEEFILDKWVPYFIEGLPLGEVKIKLELIDNNGALIPSPFNPVERTVMLEAADLPA